MMRPEKVRHFYEFPKLFAFYDLLLSAIGNWRLAIGDWRLANS